MRETSVSPTFSLCYPAPEPWEFPHHPFVFTSSSIPQLSFAINLGVQECYLCRPYSLLNLSRANIPWHSVMDSIFYILLDWESAVEFKTNKVIANICKKHLYWKARFQSQGHGVYITRESENSSVVIAPKYPVVDFSIYATIHIARLRSGSGPELKRD